MQSMHPRGSTWLKVMIATTLLGISCGGGSCAGQGCSGMGGLSGCQPGAYRYPAGDPNRPDAVLEEDAVRVRITQGFLDFLRPNLPSVIKSVLMGAPIAGITVDGDGVLHVPLPDQSLINLGIAGVHTTDSEALIWLADVDEKIGFGFEQPDRVHFALDHMRVGVNLQVHEDILFVHEVCPIIGALGPNGPGPLTHAAEISTDAFIDPAVGPDPMRALQIGVSVNDIRLNALALNVQGGGFFCGVVTKGIVGVADGLVRSLGPLLNGLLRPVIQNVLGSVLNGFNGHRGKIQTQFNLASIVPIQSLQLANPLGLFVAPEPGPFPVDDKAGLGMEVTVTSGAEAPLSDCVPVPPDFVANKGPTPALSGTDSMGRPYHVGVTLAASMINQTLYALHRSGALCLQLGTGDVRTLTGGRFTLNASLLSLLAADVSKLTTDRAPVIIQLKPRNPGTITLGSGQMTGMDAMGRPTYDWLMNASFPQMGIAFYVLMQDRYVRLFEVTTDIKAGFNINVLPSNQLEIDIGSIDVGNFQQVFNDILPNADFSTLLPTLVQIATQGLLANTLKLDVDVSNILSNALHVPIGLRVNDLFQDGANKDYLTLSLTFSAPSMFAPMSAAVTAVTMAKESLLVDRTSATARASGLVRLDVGAPGAEPVEYQVRVDGGLWHAFAPPASDGTVVFEDALLRVPGMHSIDVRARRQGDYMTLTEAAHPIEALVDPLPPTVSAVVEGDAVAITVRDAETPETQPLQLRGRLDDGAWFEIPLQRMRDGEGTTKASLPLAQVGRGTVLALIASDPAGNESPVTTVRVGLEAAPAPHAGGCACQDGPPASRRLGLGTGLSILLVGAMGARRRRRLNAAGR